MSHVMSVYCKVAGQYFQIPPELAATYHQTADKVKSLSRRACCFFLGEGTLGLGGTGTSIAGYFIGTHGQSFTGSFLFFGGMVSLCASVGLEKFRRFSSKKAEAEFNTARESIVHKMNCALSGDQLSDRFVLVPPLNLPERYKVINIITDVQEAKLQENKIELIEETKDDGVGLPPYQFHFEQTSDVNDDGGGLPPRDFHFEETPDEIKGEGCL